MARGENVETTVGMRRRLRVEGMRPFLPLRQLRALNLMFATALNSETLNLHLSSKPAKFMLSVIERSQRSSSRATTKSRRWGSGNHCLKAASTTPLNLNQTTLQLNELQIH